MMEQTVPKSEKGVNLILGLFLVGAGIVCFLLNFSVLPLIGVIIGIPCIAVGVFFLVKHKRRLTGK